MTCFRWLVTSFKWLLTSCSRLVTCCKYLVTSCSWLVTSCKWLVTSSKWLVAKWLVTSHNSLVNWQYVPNISQNFTIFKPTYFQISYFQFYIKKKKVGTALRSCPSLRSTFSIMRVGIFKVNRTTYITNQASKSSRFAASNEVSPYAQTIARCLSTSLFCKLNSNHIYLCVMSSL